MGESLFLVGFLLKLVLLELKFRCNLRACLELYVFLFKTYVIARQ